MVSAVVLAAGEGKGAWPYSGIRQKVTCPIINTPMVRRLVLHLKEAGINEISVVIGHRGEAVRACTGDIDGVSFTWQNPLKGPVDAALRGIQEANGEDVLICCADIVTSGATYSKLLKQYQLNRSEAMLLIDKRSDDTPHYTTIHVDDSGLVTGVWGHGEGPHPRYAGVCLARKDLLKRYLLLNPGLMDNVTIGEMPPVEGDIAHSFDLMRQDGIEVQTCRPDGFLVDVDRPWHIVEANYEAARYYFDQLEKSELGPGASVSDGADIASGAKLVLGPGATIGKGCHISGNLVLGARTKVINGAILHHDVVVGSDTECKDYCTIDNHAVLGSRCIFGHGSEFTGLAFDTVYLWHYCCITGLMGNNVDIGAATVCGTWRFDNGVREQKIKGHKEYPSRFGSYTYIGDYTRTGVNVMFMPGTKVGYHSCVGAGAIIYEDVPDRTLLLPKQEHITKEWGPGRYGW